MSDTDGSREQTPPASRLDLDLLADAADRGEIDTVLMACIDMQGRLQGKRLSARYFLDHIVDSGAHACNYLLAVDVDMNPVAGYSMAGWDKGYGDFVMRPDLDSLRCLSWQPRTALCIADLEWLDGTPVAESPRAILRRQVARLDERGWKTAAATELEFLVFRQAYDAAWKAGYRDLEPINRYNVDYSLFGMSQADPLLRRIADEMQRSGFTLEGAKGEANLGQHEINFRHDSAIACADSHVVFKHAVKELALQERCSATFMAKWDQREGNSCHVHLSLVDGEGGFVFESGAVFEAFLAGQLACLEELTLFLAPNVNSYKRFANESFAPTAVAWGRDNRTCALRVIGEGRALRIENRLPGADVNPYLALAATIAAGLHGIDNRLTPPPAEGGNAYRAEHRRVPGDLERALHRFAGSTVAREAFGDAVVDHYAHAAEVELAAFGAAVTDWERFRGFERL